MINSKFNGIFFGCIFTGLHIFCQQKNDLEIENMHGKVKSITNSYISETQLYTNSNRSARKKYKDVTIEYYDTSGNLLSFKSCSKKDTLISRHVFEFDKDGRRIKCTGYNSYDSADYIYTFIYNKKGFIAQQNSYSIHGSAFLKIFITYTTDGFIAEKKIYNQLNNLIKRKVYGYDHNDITEVDEFYPDNPLAIKTRYTYENMDSAGNWQKRTEFILNSFTTNFTFRKIEYYP